MTFETPIVFIIFKRPDLTQKVFEAIAQVKPLKLFVIADGPRNLEEKALCEKTRSVVNQVNWDCEVLTNFSEVNMRGPWRISSGLNWVFSLVEEAIVLEDDCLPAPSFFQFCQVLLEYYRSDERVMHISGNNFQLEQHRTDYSYYFSKYTHTWGWATWKRAWKHFHLEIPTWPEFQNSKLFDYACDDSFEKDYFGQIMQKVHSHESIHWDYAWQYACWCQGGLSILPKHNLVSNLGFRFDASHTRNSSSPLANMSVNDIWEIQHPPFIVRHKEADLFTFNRIFGGNSLRKSKINFQADKEHEQKIASAAFQEKHEAAIRRLQIENQALKLKSEKSSLREKDLQTLLKQSRQKVKKHREKLRQVRSHLREAIETISLMESSKFWKLQEAWSSVKRLLRLRA